MLYMYFIQYICFVIYILYIHYTVFIYTVCLYTFYIHCWQCTYVYGVYVSIYPHCSLGTAAGAQLERTAGGLSSQGRGDVHCSFPQLGAGVPPGAACPAAEHPWPQPESDGEIQRREETQVWSWQISASFIPLQGEFLPQSYRWPRIQSKYYSPWTTGLKAEIPYTLSQRGCQILGITQSCWHTQSIHHKLFLVFSKDCSLDS